MQERDEEMAEEDTVEDNVKYYVFVKKGRRHYDPQYISAGVTTVKWIFPVPEPDTIGTLDGHNNGIVFIKFGEYGTEPECKIIAEDFSPVVYGSFIYRFSPNFADDMIVYSKTRDAVIANVKTGEAFHIGFNIPANDYMSGIRFLDNEKNLFALVKTVKGDKPYRDYLLHVVKLEGQQFIETTWNMYLGETDCISSDFPLHHTWFVHNKNLFVYDYKWNKILCTDGKQSVSHPFSEVFNANSNRIGKVKDFAIHPTLPFGVIIDEYAGEVHDLTLARWDSNLKKKDEQVLSFGQDLEPLKFLFDLNHMTLAYQSFSPCGNWYVVGCIEPDVPQSPHFIAVPVIPVDKKHPDFFDMDNLVILGQVKDMTSIAWTSGPASYVVSNGELLHKWDLDELPNARVFVMPEDGKRSSVFGKIGRVFGVGR